MSYNYNYHHYDNHNHHDYNDHNSSGYRYLLNYMYICILFLGCEQDLVLVLDMSSTTHPIYKTYEELCVKLLHKLKIGLRYTRVALITFNSVGGTFTHFDLDRYDNVDDIVNEITGLRYTGGTTAIGNFYK